MTNTTHSYTLPLSHEDLVAIRARAQRERAAVFRQMWSAMSSRATRALRRVGSARQAAKPSTASIPCLNANG